MIASVPVVVLGVPAARLDAVERQVRGRRPADGDEPTGAVEPAATREVTRLARVRGGRVLLRLVVADEHRVARLRLESLGAPGPAVVDLARRWLVRHHLWLDPTPFDAVLDATSSGVAPDPVRRVSSELRPGTGVDSAVRHMLGGCLDQVVGNLGPIASGIGSAEHVHQARVVIRRTRTVLREFAASSPVVDQAWSDGLADIFRSLGTSRDRDVVISHWTDRLVAAGAPPMKPADDQVDDPSEVARSLECGVLLLDVLAYALGDPLESDETIESVAAARLARLHQRIARDARRFTEASVAERHATRKRLKRLRYLAELTGPVFRTRRVKRFVKALEPAQAALGEFNDLAVAEAWFRARVGEDPAAWFAVGWLAAHEPDVVAACVRPLRDVADAEPYWR